ncbi:Eukaryotic membrane protein family-domain containing protein [Rhodotorula toruloides]|uniref:Eukaryotic membrane protein family-domain containing protein n=1 Tax=Rhodotorula toruloides TaxID=5286 RepID=A0A2S9ZYY3_RHOTO|nr:Eukaryotic membrane protein family-domain containing protein [Rhodotorula toruloides]
MAGLPSLSRSLPDLTLAGASLEDDLAEYDYAHTSLPSPPRSPSPPPLQPLVNGDTGSHNEGGHVLLDSPEPLHTQLPSALRAEADYGREDGPAPNGVKWKERLEEQANGHDTPRTERSMSIGSIHSAPEFVAAPPSPTPSASTPLAREAEDGSDTSPGPARVRRSVSSERLEEVTGRRRKSLKRLPHTLWDYLQEEIFAVELDGEEGIKSERVTNFFAVPRELEKIILFGVFICLDSFLYTFTILPLRAITAFRQLVANLFHNLFLSRRSGGRKRHLRLSHKCDLTKVAILSGTLFLLHRVTDASKMYHGVRGQETIKLYVLFNVLEIADRLCCSFGQDLQDSLFSHQTFGRRTDGSHPHIRPVALFALNLVYVVAHSLVLFYQLVTLNVAINSYSNALLTLLLSNQFVEIKGSVFKKFEKENLFQLTCADIVERFQLALMLFIIALRNLIELSSASSSSLFSFLPASFRSVSLTLPSLPTLSLLQAIFSPAVVVLVSECFVDWLKHAFITKFNHIRPGVYGRFVDVLCKDLVAGAGSKRANEQPFVDQSPFVARRLGFAALPLGCLVVRVISQAFEMLADDSAVDECAPSRMSSAIGLRGIVAAVKEEDWVARVGSWAVVALTVFVVWICLVALKLLIGYANFRRSDRPYRLRFSSRRINLRAFASERWSTMLEREEEERLNDRQRPKIGVTAKEAEMDRQVASLLADDVFDSAYRNRKINLTSLTRYDMVKSRLW